MRKEVYPDICVCCGDTVPEGMQICWSCERTSENTAPVK